MKKHIIDHLSQDSRLQSVMTSVTLPPLQGGEEYVYASLIRAIVSQQLSAKAADTIYFRFLDLFPEQDPTPERLLAAPIDALRSAGLSRQKAGYVQNIARFFHEKQAPEASWTALDDEAVIQTLTQIKGVGRWTAEMVLIFTLHRPDILPLGDLGIRKAMIQLYEVEETLPKRTVQQQLTGIAESWRPYRSYACRYLWRWIDQQGG
jgi:DNA-3-methyladenine glycosylase II